jgi:hypothetical protein
MIRQRLASLESRIAVIKTRGTDSITGIYNLKNVDFDQILNYMDGIIGGVYEYSFEKVPNNKYDGVKIVVKKPRETFVFQIDVRQDLNALQILYFLPLSYGGKYHYSKEIPFDKLGKNVNWVIAEKLRDFVKVYDY